MKALETLLEKLEESIPYQLEKKVEEVLKNIVGKKFDLVLKKLDSDIDTVNRAVSQLDDDRKAIGDILIKLTTIETAIKELREAHHKQIFKLADKVEVTMEKKLDGVPEALQTAVAEEISKKKVIHQQEKKRRWVFWKK